jgi:hypothetical protein
MSIQPTTVPKHLQTILHFVRSHGNHAYILSGICVAIEVPYSSLQGDGVEILTAMTIKDARNILGY